jgi:hypothetical protein
MEPERNFSVRLRRDKTRTRVSQENTPLPWFLYARHFKATFPYRYCQTVTRRLQLPAGDFLMNTDAFFCHKTFTRTRNNRDKLEMSCGFVWGYIRHKHGVLLKRKRIPVVIEASKKQDWIVLCRWNLQTDHCKICVTYRRSQTSSDDVTTKPGKSSSISRTQIKSLNCDVYA